MFQDIGSRTFARPHAEARGETSAQSPAGPQVQEAARLIARYPDLSEPDVTRLVDLYGRLSALDTALIISDEKLGPKLDCFVNDHGHRIRTPFRHYAVFLAIAATGLLVTVWALIIA